MSSPKIFTAHLRELTERFDPRYHSPSFAENLSRIKNVNWCSIGSCCKLSEETWNKAILFPDSFPYVEISAINNEDGTIGLLETLSTAEAPNRAQMVVRSGDILVSTTRPTRNAIARVSSDTQVAIASTGFAVIREVDASILSFDYLYHALRLGFCTAQFDQRSSGGNYPAITKDDLKKIIVPVPPREVQARIVEELDAAYAAKRKADAKAAELLASIDNIVLDALGLPPLPPPDTSLQARIFTVSSRDVANKRLDAVAYQSARRQFIKNVNASPYPNQPLSTLVNDKRTQTDSLDGQIYVGMENIDGNTGEFISSERKETISSGVLFDEGDILVPRLRPYLNKIWLATFSGVASTEFYPLVAQGISAEFLTVFLRTKMISNVLTLLMTGNTLPRVQIEDVLALPIPVPPKPVQNEIVTRVSAIRADVKSLKNNTAASLAAATSCIEEQLFA